MADLRRPRQERSLKEATLKKFRRRCRSPGVQRMIKDNHGTNRLLSERRRTSSTCGNVTSLMVSRPILNHVEGSHYKPSDIPRVVDASKRLVSTARSELQRGEYFLKLSGSISSGNVVETGPSTANLCSSNVFPPAPEASADRLCVHRCSSSVGRSNNSSCCSPEVSCATARLKERILENMLTPLNSAAKDAENLRDGLDHTLLLKLNPRLKTIYDKKSRLKSLFERFASDEGWSTQDSASETEDLVEEVDRPGGTSQFGSFSDNCLSSDIVGLSRTTPTHDAWEDCTKYSYDHSAACLGSGRTDEQLRHQPFRRFSFEAGHTQFSRCHGDLPSGLSRVAWSPRINSIITRSPSFFLSSASSPIESTIETPFHEKLRMFAPEPTSRVAPMDAGVFTADNPTFNCEFYDSLEIF